MRYMNFMTWELVNFLWHHLGIYLADFVKLLWKDTSSSFAKGMHTRDLLSLGIESIGNKTNKEIIGRLI